MRLPSIVSIKKCIFGVMHTHYLFNVTSLIVLSSKRLNKGLKEFEGRDRAFIIRFDEDNSYVTLDYRSSSILQQDLVERLGLAKNDKVLVRCARGDYIGKIWFLGTNEEVLAQEKVAETIMRRIESGENINLSDVSLSQSFFNKEQENIQPSPLAQHIEPDSSDSETDPIVPAKKRKITASSSNTESNEPLTAASMPARVRCPCVV